MKKCGCSAMPAPRQPSILGVLLLTLICVEPIQRYPADFSIVRDVYINGVLVGYGGECSRSPCSQSTWSRSRLLVRSELCL
jgi:hypothetical protein